MAILFFSEGSSLFGDADSCSSGPRKSKPIALAELKVLTKKFFDRTQQGDLPDDLSKKILAGGRFPLKEVQMLISQNPEAEYLQVNYGIDADGKHFHYMFATKAAALIEAGDNTLIIEDCCRIPPNTASIASFF